MARLQLPRDLIWRIALQHGAGDQGRLLSIGMRSVRFPEPARGLGWKKAQQPTVSLVGNGCGRRPWTPVRGLEAGPGSCFGRKWRKTQGSRGERGFERNCVIWTRPRTDTLESIHLRMENGMRAGDPVETRRLVGPPRTWKCFEGSASWKVGDPGLRPWCAGCNTTNPMIGSGVQQTRAKFEGENRQGGEKPRRWNVPAPGNSRPNPETAQAGSGGSGPRMEMSMEGQSLETP